MTERKKYTAEFKQRAVDLVIDSGRPVAPVFGVMLTDYFVIRRKTGPQVEELYKGRESIFWGVGGFNLNGYAAAVLGAIVYVVLVVWVRPEAPWVLASVVTLIVSSCLYVILQLWRGDKQRPNAEASQVLSTSKVPQSE